MGIRLVRLVQTRPHVPRHLTRHRDATVTMQTNLRSGKIMRRLLRSVAKGEAITQDTCTLENPAILEQFSQTS